MNKLENLKSKVASLYEAKDPNRDPWTDWLYDQHVRFVARNARSIAESHGANPDLAEAAGWLHDIADVKMLRREANHEAESLRIARQLMEESGYSEEEIALVVDDAVRLHSCHDGERPESREGQALATADALAHFQTDFYIFASQGFADRPLEQLKEWVLKKIDRDLNHKICFDDVRETVRHDYEVIKDLFSRAPVK